MSWEASDALSGADVLPQGIWSGRGIIVLPFNDPLTTKSGLTDQQAEHYGLTVNALRP